MKLYFHGDFCLSEICRLPKERKGKKFRDTKASNHRKAASVGFLRPMLPASTANALAT